MKKAKETTTNKPSISPEAQNRIRVFVKAVEALQKEHGVEIGVFNGDALGLRDKRRKDTWNGYGEWDAAIYGDMPGIFRVKNIEFEDFDLWGK